MGANFSEERGGDAAEVLTLQQQRAQFLLIQQIQEARVAQMRENGPAAAAALGAIGIPAMRQVDQPSLLIAPVLKNPVHLRSKTLALAPPLVASPANQRLVPAKGEPLCLRFGFDATQAGTVTVYRSAVLASQSRGAPWEVESAAWSSPPTPFSAGLGQAHSVEWVSLAPSQAVNTITDTDGLHWPLLVELRAEKPGQEDGSPPLPCCEWTMCRLVNAPSGKTKVEVVQQQVCCGNNQVLDVNDFFGAEFSADGFSRQDCTVCQSEPRDTAVLPCRHMCLCKRCSEYIRTRVQYHSYKCPICREKIGRMMQIEPQDEELEENEVGILEGDAAPRDESILRQMPAGTEHEGP
mmetsp:Transcript_146869/g.258859  ORF Transcript_146869/g.258859 Transcript_146869/m.258859 type:complete len:351 (-) Transcript_146869:30-1082(-)